MKKILLSFVPAGIAGCAAISSLLAPTASLPTSTPLISPSSANPGSSPAPTATPARARLFSGNVIVFKVNGTGCANDTISDCNGPLFLAELDAEGNPSGDIRELKDKEGRRLFGSQPALSPDGQKLAWVVWPGQGSGEIASLQPTASTIVARMGSSGDVMVVTGGTPESGFNVDPSWSPDSQILAFASDREDASGFDIYEIGTDREGLSPTRIASSAADQRYPAWNPADADVIAVAVHANSIDGIGQRDSSAAWNLMLLDKKTGTYTRQLTALSQVGPNGSDFALEPRWKPGGQWLAFTFRGPLSGNQSNAQRYQRVSIQDLNASLGSGHILNPTEQGGALVAEGSPAWTPDGGSIAYLRYLVDEAGNPGSEPQLYKGIPNLNNSPGTIEPKQWSISRSVPAFHLLATSGSPVGGWAFDLK